MDIWPERGQLSGPLKQVSKGLTALTAVRDAARNFMGKGAWASTRKKDTDFGEALGGGLVYL